MIKAQYHDLKYNPIGFWNFNNTLNDISGLNSHFSIEAGTERYALLMPGIKGFFFDGSTRLISLSTHSSLRITGDMTFEMLCLIPKQNDVDLTNSPTVVCLGNFGTSGEANNQLYDFNCRSEGDITFYHEFGSSSAVTRNFSNVSISQGTPTHVAWKRESNRYYIFINGELKGVSTVTTPPTGGTNSNLRMGSAGESGGLPGTFDPHLTNAIISSVKIFNFALSDNQIKSEYNRTFADVFGVL